MLVILTRFSLFIERTSKGLRIANVQHQIQTQERSQAILLDLGGVSTSIEDPNPRFDHHSLVDQLGQSSTDGIKVTVYRFLSRSLTCKSSVS